MDSADAEDAALAGLGDALLGAPVRGGMTAEGPKPLGLLSAADFSLTVGIAFINTRISLVVRCSRSMRSYISLSRRLSSARASPARHSIRNTARSASDTEFSRATSMHSSARGIVRIGSAAGAANDIAMAAKKTPALPKLPVRRIFQSRTNLSDTGLKST